MIATLFVVFAALSLAATTVALVRVRHPAWFAFPIMMTAWLTGEYPVFHLLWQAAAAVVFIAAGALDRTRGVVALVLLLVSFAGLLRVRSIARRARPSAVDALRRGLGDRGLASIPIPDLDRLTSETSRHSRRPLHFDTTGVDIISDLSYGDHRERHRLDVYRPSTPVSGAPVIVQIHGGAWIIGHKKQQGQPLLHQLARNGHVCVAINYRLGPKSRFPDQIIDVKRAIAWVREHIADYGGDPDTIILTGGSAGGHLASLAALTPDERAWQPRFETADTSVAACVPFYGPPDLIDRDGLRGRLASMEPFLTRMVMPAKPDEAPELWNAVSPIAHVGPHAPPFFVIQGHNDVLVWHEEAQVFVDRLGAASEQPVSYWEVPGAQHAFDTFNSHRSAAAVDAVQAFIAWLVADARVRSEETS